MNLKKLALVPFSLLLLSSVASATVYEDGVMKNWKVDDNRPAGATISSLQTAGGESDTNKHVIELKGAKRSNAYIVTMNNRQDERVLNFDMNFNEKFIFSVYIKTDNGERVLTYDYKDSDKGEYNQNRKKKYYGFGIGKGKGTWQNISRDLEADLQKYEPNNKIVKVRSFKVRGSGQIDNVSLTKDKVNNGGNGNDNDLEKKFATAEGQELLKLALSKKTHPAKGVNILSFSKNKFAYIVVDSGKFSKDFLGLTYVDISNPRKLKVLGYTKDIFSSKALAQKFHSFLNMGKNDDRILLATASELNSETGLMSIYLLSKKSKNLKIIKGYSNEIYELLYNYYDFKFSYIGNDLFALYKSVQDSEESTRIVHYIPNSHTMVEIPELGITKDDETVASYFNLFIMGAEDTKRCITADRIHEDAPETVKVFDCSNLPKIKLINKLEL